jgi:hypothetical protein
MLIKILSFWLKKRGFYVKLIVKKLQIVYLFLLYLYFSNIINIFLNILKIYL